MNKNDETILQKAEQKAEQTGEKTFEKSLAELEQIVKQMESGNLSLEKAVKKYTAGINQSIYCLDLLDKTEKKNISAHKKS